MPKSSKSKCFSLFYLLHVNGVGNMNGVYWYMRKKTKNCKSGIYTNWKSTIKIGRAAFLDLFPIAIYLDSKVRSPSMPKHKRRRTMLEQVHWRQRFERIGIRIAFIN